jgi:ATP-dependent RNA helicase DDX10/DBP4
MPNKEIFKIEELPYEEYAASLGLAAAPSVRFLKELKSKSRDDLRSSKNVNRKLEKLKEQIKADKLKKRMEKLGMSIDQMDSNAKRKRDDDDDILIMKKRDTEHQFEQSELPAVDINAVTSSRSDKRIKIDASSSRSNKHVVFDDDGKEADDDLRHISRVESGASQNIAEANEDYLRRVKARLAANKEVDKLEEQDRIRERHKLKKMKAKSVDDNDDDEGEGVMVTLATSDVESDNESSSNESDAQNSYSSDSESDDSEESNSHADVKAKEDMALAMIRNS